MKRIMVAIFFLSVFYSGCCFGQDGSEKDLFILQSRDDLNGWLSVNDSVMGGISSGGIVWEENAAVFKGVLSLDNNGGFSSIRSPDLNFDMASFKGLSVMVRGDGREYALTLHGGYGDRGYLFRAFFRPQHGEWEKVRIPFTDFKASFRGVPLPFLSLDLQKIDRIGILISDKKEGPFSLGILWFRGYLD